MSVIDLDSFRATPLMSDPYEFLVVSGFIKPEALTAIVADFPTIPSTGSHSVREFKSGPHFGSLIKELRAPEIEHAFAEKFGLDLSRRPRTVTLRGQCKATDGEIHSDTESKLITVLIYMNLDWTEKEGRLRVLRSPQNLEDFVAEVVPEAGTLLAFRRSNNSWHGHTEFVGERRSIQLNWVTTKAAAYNVEVRHEFSAWTKKLNPFASAGRDG